MIEFGALGVDGVVVRWVGAESGEEAPDSIRAAITVEPIQLQGLGVFAVLAGSASVLPMEATVSVDPSTGSVELTRFKASLLRLALAQMVPVEVLTAYRDLDRGITYGGDLLSFRIPIKVTPGGEIVVMPGMEIGVRHYGAVDTTAFHTSFVVDARASVDLISGWLSTGVMGTLRYDLATGGMSGLGATGTGFLALALDSENRLFARMYGGVQYDSNRDDLGMAPTAIFGGLGIFGGFGGR